jgi:hypothetical protein
MLLWGSVFTLGASMDVLPSSALSPTLLLRIHPQHRDPDKMVSTDKAMSNISDSNNFENLNRLPIFVKETFKP